MYFVMYFMARVFSIPIVQCCSKVLNTHEIVFILLKLSILVNSYDIRILTRLYHPYLLKLGTFFLQK